MSNRNCAARLAAGLLLLLAGCAVARPPEEQPTQILDLARRLPVFLRSNPSGIEVFGEGRPTEPGPRLGTTPLQIDEVVIEKEMWKHGQSAPPEPESRPLLSHASGRGGELSVTRGNPLAWALWIVDRPGSAPRRVVVSLPSEALAQAFSRGRIELTVPPTEERGSTPETP